MHSLLAWFFKLLVQLRHFFYDRQWLATHQAKIKVIGIGSIQMGGSGKTPFCVYLGKLLSQMKVTFGFVSRGYKAKAENHTALISKIDPAYFGDEPIMIHAHFPQIPFVVGKNRLEAVNLLAQRGAKVAVLDDGFQHRKLQKDLQIILLDSLDPFSGGVFFPKGNLRDDPKRLANASLIVAIGNENSMLQEKLSRYTKAPIIWAKKVYGPILDTDHKSLSIEGKKIAAFAGIAKPSDFFSQLTNYHLVLTKSLSDHAKWTSVGLNRFMQKAKKLGAEYIICTEKDIVKIPKTAHLLIPIGYLSMEIQITSGEKTLMNMIRRICILEKKQMDVQHKDLYVSV